MKIESVKLLYNMAAHLAASEKYPNGLMNELKIPGAASFDAMFWAFAECAKQAELYRRFLGEKPRRILTEQEWRLIVKPGQNAKMAEMLLKAITEGLGDGADDDQEIDEVLAELEKKSGKTSA